MKKNPKKIKFFENLVQSETNNVPFIVHVISAKEYQKIPPPLLAIIGLDKKQISNIANAAIESIEEYEKLNNDWLQFKWRLWAFLELQDLFDAPFYKHTSDPLVLFHLWYFYYESKHVLFESLLTGLNGFYHASQTILRLFLEFSVLQNYYYLHSFKSKSYLDVMKCLSTGIKPRWNTLIRGILPDNNSIIQIKTIEKRIEAHYDALSEKCLHAYHQDFSPKVTNRRSTPSHSLIGVMTFWRLIDFILESVIRIYYVNFPMALQPKDIVKKFGYNGPVGIFLDSSRGHIMRNALKKADLELFQKFSNQNEDVKSLNEWFNERNDLTLDEIRDTWNKDEDGEFPENIEIAYLIKTAKLRAIREAMSLQKIDSILDNNIDLSKVDFSLTGWSNIFAAQKRKGHSNNK